MARKRRATDEFGAVEFEPQENREGFSQEEDIRDRTSEIGRKAGETTKSEPPGDESSMPKRDES